MSDGARALELIAADERARRVVQELFDRPLVLEAGAGTGKTTSLVARVIAWSIGPGWTLAEAALRGEGDVLDAVRAEALRPDRVAARILGRVVAITFTEAAAAEMSERIGEALLQISTGILPLGMDEEFLPADMDERRRRGGALQGALDHLVVQTIHAYCRRLLTAYPLEAGLHPRLEVDADGTVQREVVRELLLEKLANAYAQGRDPSYLELAGRGGGPRELEAQLLAFAAAGLTSEALSRDPLAPAPMTALCERLENALTAFRSAADGCLHGVKGSLQTVATVNRIDDTVTWLEKHREQLVGPNGRAALEDLLEWTQEKWDGDLDKLKKWARDDFGVKEIAALGERSARVAAASALLRGLISHLLSLDLALLDLARPILCELMEEMERRMRSMGVSTFTSLLAAARDLLSGQPDVAARVRAGIDQLLVDEFQDTDRCQCDIVRSIALAGPAEDRPGLLLVGDPKQSIYGWRSADLAAYDAFVRDVLASGGESERLSVNYRSVPLILEEVERAIEPVMEPCEGLQPEFQPLVACEANRQSPGLSASAATELRAVEYWVSALWDSEAKEPLKSTSPEANELEAVALARDLRALHDEHDVDWGDVGVLFRSRTDWEVYLGALRAAGVPFVVEGDRNYYKRREIIDAAALVRHVVDPNDHVALLTWLRCAAVGVPDAALIPLWSQCLPERMGDLYGTEPAGLASLCNDVEEVARDLPSGIPGLSRVDGWERNLIFAVSWLGPLRECFDTEPGDVFVERLRTVSLFEATEAARYLGAWRSANLERFFAELTAALSEDGDAMATLRRLRRAVAEQEDASEARPVEENGDSVRVMTWHGSKGLDFEHVYLMQLHKGSVAGASRDACAGEFDGRSEYRAFGAPTLAWDAVEAGAERVGDAERVRMLYVAMTRAKRRLVLAGLWPSFQKSKRAGQPVALLQARDGGVPDFESEMQKLAEQQDDRFADASGALWVFPGLVASAPLEGAEEAVQGTPLPTPEEIGEAAAVLHRAGQSAALRMQRTVGGRASGGGHEPFWDTPDGDGALRSATPSGALAGDVARQVGTAIHRVLEELDLDADPERALTDARALLAQVLSGQLEGRDLEAGLEAAGALLQKIATGTLLRRLYELAPHIVARELPVLLPPDAPGGEEAAAAEDRVGVPVGFVAGAIDLVYRDPDTGELVIADYKTDRLQEADLERTARQYASQGRFYQRALREALGLETTPRFELWFLSLDRMVTI